MPPKISRVNLLIDFSSSNILGIVINRNIGFKPKKNCYSLELSKPPGPFVAAAEGGGVVELPMEGLEEGEMTPSVHSGKHLNLGSF